jgi:hypothetical protein
MDVADLARKRPQNIDNALADMRTALASFDEARDHRAYFVRVYMMMTQDVSDAVHGNGDYAGRRVFMDPDWIRGLSGRFATRYFESLDITEATPGCGAWKAAHDVGRTRRAVVLEDVLLGINAHINYDLAQAIAANLDPAELEDEAALRVRKFDHDQVNNLLKASINRIQDALADNYEPALRPADHLLGGLDERMSDAGLKHYREHVWGDALELAKAMAAGGGRDEAMRTKLDLESSDLAEEITSWRTLWRIERMARAIARPFRRPQWGQVPGPTEPQGGTAATVST